MYNRMKNFIKKVIKNESEAPVSEKKQKYVIIVSEKAGVTLKEAEAMMTEAKKRIGISFRNYCENDFYNIPVEMQEERYKTILQIKEEQKRLKEQKKAQKAINKERKETCISKTVEATGWTREEAERKIEDARKRTGCQYEEYYIFRFYQLTEEEQDQMCLSNMASKISGLYDTNKEFSNVLNDKSKESFAKYTNILHVVTIVSNTKKVTEDGQYMDFAYAALRIGEKTESLANFHSGEMAAAVDLETGMAVTDAVDVDGNVYQTHPCTGAKIKGFQVPFVKEALSMLEEFCSKEQVEGKLGWDIAITEEGPVVIGVNADPDNMLLQAPYAVEKKGVKSVLEKYLLLEENEKDRKKIERRENCINATVEATGWTREYAIEQIDDARSRLGIKYLEYYKNDFYFIPIEEQADRYAELKRRKEDLSKAKEEAIEKIMAKTGWSHEETLERVAEAKKRTGCDAKEFFIYRFYELTEEEQAKVFLIKESKQIAEKFDTNAKFRSMLTDKEATNKNFSKYLKRPWCVNTKISEKEFVNKFKDSKRVIYKPLNGNRGFGVEAFDVDINNAKEVYKKLQLLPAGVVEQYVVQHPTMSALTPDSVNTVRIVMIASNKKPVTPDGKYMDIAYAALRIGGGKSIVDNFHSGGMVAAVDLETGTLVTNAADMEGNVFENHPVTGMKIRGFEIPYFKEAVQMAIDAHESSEIEGYIGWDIAITENGPVLIEINLRPGVVLLSMPYAPDHKGMRDKMKKYLES